jgi:hypothetical protein
MFIRIMVVDPEPKNPRDDALVFQLPEHSRQEELFCWLLDEANIEWVKIEAPAYKRKAKVIDEQPRAVIEQCPQDG